MSYPDLLNRLTSDTFWDFQNNNSSDLTGEDGGEDDEGTEDGGGARRVLETNLGELVLESETACSAAGRLIGASFFAPAFSYYVRALQFIDNSSDVINFSFSSCLSRPLCSMSKCRGLSSSFSKLIY